MVGLPHTTAWEMAKRCGRYLSGKPRMVRRFVAQLPVDTTTLIVDSDHAGCSRTRMSTTGMSAYRGKHVIKAASNTQTVIVVSSRESDVYAMVLGTATALGIKRLRTWPENTVATTGRRNGSTRGDTVVVGAGSFAQARCADSENPSHQLEDSLREIPRQAVPERVTHSR